MRNLSPTSLHCCPENKSAVSLQISMPMTLYCLILPVTVKMAGSSIKHAERWPGALASQRIAEHSVIPGQQPPASYTVAGLPAPKGHTRRPIPLLC